MWERSCTASVTSKLLSKFKFLNLKNFKVLPCFTSYNNHRAGEMALSMCLLCKHGDLEFGSQTLRKKLGLVTCDCNAIFNGGMQKQGDPWPAILAELLSFSSGRDSVSKDKCRDCSSMTTEISPGLLSRTIYTHACIHHTQTLQV